MEGVYDITLGNVAGGAAGELFDREFRRALDNIHDPNTNPKQKRKITLEFVITPSEDLEEAVIVVRAKSSLAEIKPASSTVFMGRRNGRVVAVAYDPRYAGTIFGDEEDEKVLPLHERSSS